MGVDAIITILNYGLKYGPEAVKLVTNLLRKADPTLDDIDQLFADLKPYEDFSIPDVAPTAPVAVTEPAAVSTPPTESSSVAPSPS